MRRGGRSTGVRQVTIRFALADLDLARYAREAQEIRMPTLLVLAGRDRIIDNARVRAFAAQMATPRRQVIEYPQATHTIDFESDAARFYVDLAGCVRGTAEPA